MRQITLHDTRRGEPLELVPRDPGKIGIYACGPTVYNRIHVGNARPFVVFSLLKRFLEHEGHDVTLVVNITDVNDKIYDAARPLGVPSAQLAEEMAAHYIADTSLLELGRPDAEPLASESIDGIVDLHVGGWPVQRVVVDWHRHAGLQDRGGHRRLSRGLLLPRR